LYGPLAEQCTWRSYIAIARYFVLVYSVMRVLDSFRALIVASGKVDPSAMLCDNFSSISGCQTKFILQHHGWYLEKILLHTSWPRHSWPRPPRHASYVWSLSAHNASHGQTWKNVSTSRNSSSEGESGLGAVRLPRLTQAGRILSPCSFM
jgi:hypothetical protein